MAALFPFSAIVGQDEMKLSLLIAAIDQSVGGVLVLGDRGTGKSTAVRALAALLPQIESVSGCPYRCSPKGGACTHSATPHETALAPVPVVDLPLGATEDRLTGALDIERALLKGEKVFEPDFSRGPTALSLHRRSEPSRRPSCRSPARCRGVGENVVERDGLSVRHPARFVLVGSGNPEEGELRPQLLDRFGLCVDVRTPQDLKTRIEVVKRRDAFERDTRKLHQPLCRG